MAEDLQSDLRSLRIDRNAPPPKSSGWALWLVGALLLGGAGLWLTPHLEARIFKTDVELTTVTRISPTLSAVKLNASGYVQPELVTRITSKVPARVARVHVKQGQPVVAGQLLLELDSTDEQARIAVAEGQARAAQAQSRSAEAQIAVSQAQLQEAEAQAARERSLAAEQVVGFAVADDLDRRVNSLRQGVLAAKSTAKAARAQAAALQLEVDALKTSLSSLTLTSTIAGTVINRPPPVGEQFGPQLPALARDVSGIEVADFSTLMVATDIPEGRLSLLKLGDPAIIVLDAFPERRFRGRLTEITPRVDRVKATVVVRVAFVERPEGLLPDMSARVNFLRKEPDAEALSAPSKTVVPSSAVAERSGDKVVFVVEDNRVSMAPIVLGTSSADGVELLSGPAAGTQIVNAPPDTLTDGQSVKARL